MRRKLIAVLVVTGICGLAWAQDDAHQRTPAHTLTCLGCMGERDTLTDNWFGFGDTLNENGISVDLDQRRLHQRTGCSDAEDSQQQLLSHHAFRARR